MHGGTDAPYVFVDLKGKSSWDEFSRILDEAQVPILARSRRIPRRSLATLGGDSRRVPRRWLRSLALGSALAARDSFGSRRSRRAKRARRLAIA